MKKAQLYIVATLITLVAAGCKSEKKGTYYSDIYAEKPVTVYIAPVEDQMERKVEKYPKDIAYNNELNAATQYFYQTMAHPLVNHGYYVIGPAASRQIAEQYPRTFKQLKDDDLAVFANRYGVDAVLVTTIHKWKEENGRWIVFLEYRLRSTKSNTELMHKWVMAVKEVPTNLKGDPQILKQDKDFAELMDFDNGTAQRCFLVEKVNDYVLRNIPISASRRQFEDDRYKSASDTYVRYTWNENGQSDVQPCSIEEYEQGAFL